MSYVNGNRLELILTREANGKRGQSPTSNRRGETQDWPTEEGSGRNFRRPKVIFNRFGRSWPQGYDKDNEDCK